MEIMLNIKTSLLKKVKKKLKKEGISQDQIVSAYFEYIVNHQKLPFHNTLNCENMLDAKIAKRFDKYDQNLEVLDDADDSWYRNDIETLYKVEDPEWHLSN